MGVAWVARCSQRYAPLCSSSDADALDRVQVQTHSPGYCSRKILDIPAKWLSNASLSRACGATHPILTHPEPFCSWWRPGPGESYAVLIDDGVSTVRMNEACRSLIWQFVHGCTTQWMKHGATSVQHWSWMFAGMMDFQSWLHTTQQGVARLRCKVRWSTRVALPRVTR